MNDLTKISGWTPINLPPQQNNDIEAKTSAHGALSGRGLKLDNPTTAKKSAGKRGRATVDEEAVERQSSGSTVPRRQGTTGTAQTTTTKKRKNAPVDDATIS